MNQHPLQRLVYVALLAVLVTPHTVRAQAKAAPPIEGVIGKLQSFDGKSLDVQTPSGVVHVIVKQPVTTYKQIPSDPAMSQLRLISASRRPRERTGSKWRSRSSYFPRN
jgi:hypothetical protein